MPAANTLSAPTANRHAHQHPTHHTATRHTATQPHSHMPNTAPAHASSRQPPMPITASGGDLGGGEGRSRHARHPGPGARWPRGDCPTHAQPRLSVAAESTAHAITSNRDLQHDQHAHATHSTTPFPHQHTHSAEGCPLGGGSAEPCAGAPSDLPRTHRQVPRQTLMVLRPPHLPDTHTPRQHGGPHAHAHNTYTAKRPHRPQHPGLPHYAHGTHDAHDTDTADMPERRKRCNATALARRHARPPSIEPRTATRAGNTHTHT